MLLIEDAKLTCYNWPDHGPPLGSNNAFDGGRGIGPDGELVARGKIIIFEMAFSGLDTGTEVGTKSPANAKKRVQRSDNAPPGGLPGQCAENCVGTVSDLPPSVDSSPPIGPKRRPCDQSMRSQEIFLGSSIIGLPSEDRVKADTSAVQDFWCPPPY